MRPGFDLQGKRVLVVGLARTGMAAALFSAGYGATVTATDEKPEPQLAETAARLRDAGVKLELGGHNPASFLEQDLIVVSPGVPAKIPPLEQARSKGILVWSEVELAWRFLRGKLVAITGSNGKTTTTSLVAHILKTAEIPTLVGGNIGVPLLALVERSLDTTVTVAEISSFQLETIEAFRPEIGVLLNLSPDHLDRHTTLDEYARAKMRMFENQLDRDAAVLNADDPEVTRRMPSKPHIYWFSRQKRVAEGAFLRDDQIVFRADGAETVLARREDIPLHGEHNVENVLAACAAAYLAGAAPAAIAAGVKSFPGVEHRLEYVAEISGVAFYNDSKATNVDATLKAVESFPGPLIVILGGKDKGSPYTPLREPLGKRARLTILIGAAAEKIAADLDGAVPLERAGMLDYAVEMAMERARPGDTVLLAPACASFDQFENFEHRGRVFKELVAALKNQSAAGAAAPERLPMPRSLEPDKKLFGATLALCLTGAVMVFSSSAVTLGQQTGNGYTLFLRQILWIALGIAGMLCLMNTDYRKLRQPRVIFTLLSVTLVLLIAVLFLDRSHATHRWIRMGPLSLQPSELAKLAVIFYFAWFLEIRRAPRALGVNDPVHTLAPALGTAVVISGLILAEPDMGTACMILLIAFVLLFVCGLSFRYILAAGLVALPAIYIAIVRVPYRLERANAFLSPGSDPQGHGFQLLQSLIAVGSGGFTGVGLMESHQKLFFLPEANTDFIFAIICEELGFLGAVFVLGLFAAYGWRGFVAAMKAPDDFGRLLALGITTMVVGQAMINLSVVLGLMPTKGIPLPFISYGGSSLLGMLLATGVLLNISQHADET